MNKGEPSSCVFCIPSRYWQCFVSIACTAFVSVALVLSCIFLTTSAHAITKAVPDYKVKAALLAQFLRYVQWPETDGKWGGDIVVGIIGEDPYGEFLDSALSAQTVDGRNVRVTRFLNLDDLQPVQVLIVGEGNRFKSLDVLKKAKDWPVLTVGEGASFVEEGGIISFVTDSENNRVRFHLNMKTAKKRGIGIYPRLAKWAERVLD